MLTLPVFEFDGEEETRVEFAPKLVKVFYRGWVCRYVARRGTFAETGLRYFNRNGRYRRIDCAGKRLQVYVTIERENRGVCSCGATPERDGDRSRYFLTNFAIELFCEEIFVRICPHEIDQIEIL